MHHFPDGLSIRGAVDIQRDRVLKGSVPRSEELILRPITVSGFNPAVELVPGGHDPRDWNTYPPRNTTVLMPLAITSPLTGHVEPNILRLSPSSNGKRVVVLDRFTNENTFFDVPPGRDEALPDELLDILGSIPDHLREAQAGWTLEMRTMWPHGVNLGGPAALQGALSQALMSLDNLQKGRPLVSTADRIVAGMSAGTTRWFGGEDFVHIPFNPEVTDELYRRLVVGYKKGDKDPIIRLANSSNAEEILALRTELGSQGAQILHFEKPDLRPLNVSFVPNLSNLQRAHQ